MGGAPANFACHARALGAEAQVVSRVGADGAGVRLLDELTRLGLEISGISIDPTHPTGSVGVTITHDGQPVFTIEPDVAWDHIISDILMENLFKRADAVCFGTLAQRSATSAKSTRGLVALTGPDALRVFAVNLRQNHYSTATVAASMELANVLKVNEDELPRIAGMLGISGNVRECLNQLVSGFGLRLIAYTRGAAGSILYDGTEWSEHPGLAVEVRVTIGAGDSFTAAVTIGLLNRWPIARISKVASEVAAYVCSSTGAVPHLPESILERFEIEAVTTRPIFRSL